MLDRQRTDKELDALADLYLTGPDESQDAASSHEAIAINAHRDSSAQRRKAPLGNQPNLQNDPSNTSDHYPGTRSTGLMTGAQPARVSAKIPMQSDNPNNKVDDAHAILAQRLDELTATAKNDEPTLRLVNLELESAMPTRPRNADAESDINSAGIDTPSDSSVLEMVEPFAMTDKRVEVVFLGNLPGFASPWMTQYAQHVALECGVVGVLHIDDEQIDLDFVTTPANRMKLDALHQQIMHFDQADDLIAVLDMLNQGNQPMVGALLIHLATPLTATTQAIARSLPVWTLLSGVDEAAGARAMDWLSHCITHAKPAKMNHVQFMAMGSDIDRAVALIRQLDERALEQWDTSIELVGVQRQMVLVHLQTLGSFPTMLEQWPVVARLVAGDAASADHRNVLVTRIDPQVQNQQPVTPSASQQETPETPRQPRVHDFEATVTAEEARNLLMAAAKMDGISIQGVELEETETPETDNRMDVLESSQTEDLSDTGSFDAIAENDADELSVMEAEALQMDNEQPTAHDIATHAVPQPEVVSDTVRNFVQRLKQQELRKRQQARQSESTETFEPDTQEGDARPIPEPAMSVAQVAQIADDSERDIQAQIISAKPDPQPIRQEPKPQVKPVFKPQVTRHAASHEPLETQEAYTSPQPHLASYLQASSLITLTARCPQHPQVELTLDESGGLHLLARHQQATGISVRDALYEMLDARGWVDQHISLLSLTQKQLRFDVQIRPVVHLFTDDARGAAQLVANSAKFVKLHLLSEVSIGDQSAFYCTELN